MPYFGGGSLKYIATYFWVRFHFFQILNTIFLRYSLNIQDK
jgi:hypothetical protein